MGMTSLLTQEALEPESITLLAASQWRIAGSVA